MDKKTLALIAIAAIAIGSAVYLWVHRAPVIPALEMEHTNQIVNEMRETMETVTARIQERDTQVRTEVRYVYEQTRTRVNAFPADDIADGLNAELALFREMDPDTGGLDCD